MSRRTPRGARPSVRCKKAIAALPPGAFDSLDTLVTEVQRRRSRQLTIETAPAPHGSAPSGLWLRSHHRDRIVVSEGVSETHRCHIILHELGHMLLGHTTECGTALASSSREALLSHLSDDLINFILHRRTYENTDETEAELFATLVGVKLLRNRSFPMDQTSSTLQRIADSFDLGKH